MCPKHVLKISEPQPLKQIIKDKFSKSRTGEPIKTNQRCG